MTDEEKSILVQFEELKEKAKQKKKDILNDIKNYVDIHYFYSLSAMYQLRRLGAFSEDEVEAHRTELRNRYKADKKQYLLRQTAEKKMHETKMKCSQCITELTKRADELSDFEVVEKCLPVIGMVFGEPTVEVIRKKLSQRNEKNMLPICKDESEGYIRELLLMLRLNSEAVEELIDNAKTVGQGSYSGFSLAYEGEKFNLYRIPGVILC